MPDMTHERKAGDSKTEHLDQVEQFMAREMPTLVGNMLENEIHAHGAVSKERLIDIVETAQGEVFRRLRSSDLLPPIDVPPPALVLERTSTAPNGEGIADENDPQQNSQYSVLTDFDLAQLEDYFSQCTNQELGTSIANDPGGGHDTGIHKQHQYAVVSGMHLHDWENYGVGMPPHHDIGVEAGT